MKAVATVLTTCASLFGRPACTHDAALPPVVNRRAALTTAAAGLATGLVGAPPPAFAEMIGGVNVGDSGMDDAWTLHDGPFTKEFFEDFTVSKASPDFVYKFIKDGDGGKKPVKGQNIKVNYRGYLMDGSLIDSSYGRKKPFKFRMGKGKVIIGWEGVLQGMPLGQRVVVKIPPQYAYGPEKKGKIPGNSELIFYMELVELGDIDIDA